MPHTRQLPDIRHKEPVVPGQEIEGGIPHGILSQTQGQRYQQHCDPQPEPHRNQPHGPAQHKPQSGASQHQRQSQYHHTQNSAQGAQAVPALLSGILGHPDLFEFHSHLSFRYR